MMFGEIGSIFNLLKNLPKLKEEAEKMRSRLNTVVAEGEAGAGMVKAKANGAMEIVRIEITDEAMADRELLEGLVAAACSQALKKVQMQVGEETRKTLVSAGLPEGVNLPSGFPGLG
ncbi:MAG: YbaB/EbfC family nucleoid-associated protein [Gemmataceae bacterium]|nr:YbaB/EbfC family nucleoid-associated protein [Gemmataceae bacterium]